MTGLSVTPFTSLDQPWTRPTVTFSILVMVLSVLPWLIHDYQLIFVAEVLIWGLFAMSFAMVYGYGGMLTFAQAVFFGAGCWGFNFGTFYFGFNIWGGVLCAFLAAIIFAAISFSATNRGYANFLSDQEISYGIAHIDVVWHSTWASIINNYGQVSTGLHGLPDLRYHVFSHFFWEKKQFP